MKFGWKGLFLSICLGILVFSHILMGLYVYANIIDWKIDFLNLNPTEQSNERHFPIMTYPPSNGSGFEITDSRITIIFEHFYLRCNGTAAENKPFELSVIGTLTPELAQKIESVSLYFDGALSYPVKNGFMYTGGWGIMLAPTSEDPFGNSGINMGAFLADYPTVITWQAQGDYYPSITISFVNHTRVMQSY